MGWYDGSGWFDDHLEHSSGPWKKHKYFEKIGEGANAVYRYAKDAAKKVGDKAQDMAWDAEIAAYNASEATKKAVKDKTGLTAREKYYDSLGDYERAKEIDQDFKKGDEKWFNSEQSKRRSTREIANEKKAVRRRNQFNAEWVKERRDTAHAAKQVYDKTLAGKVENTVNRAHQLLEKKKKKRKK